MAKLVANWTDEESYDLTMRLFDYIWFKILTKEQREDADLFSENMIATYMKERKNHESNQ